jgi:type IV pilus assembly protein PilM
MGLPFFKGQAKRRDQIVALDLGDRSTKAIYLQRRGEQFSLVNYALVDSPITEKGPTPEIWAEHFRTVARTLGVSGKGRRVTLAIGVNDSLFRQVELPLMPLGDMRQMLKFNAKSYLQQELNDYVYDCAYVLNTSGNKPIEVPKASGGQIKQKVLVGGARRQLIEDLQNAVRQAGLIPDQIIPALAGPVNAFELAEPEVFAKEVVALVDVGFKNTTIVILSSGELKLHRVVAIGGDRLTAGLAESLAIGYAEAENIKVGMASEVQAALEAQISPLGRELRASVDFFEHQHDRNVTQVFVSGGSARNELVVQSLQAELMVPCKSWNPLRSLQVELPPDRASEFEQTSPQLTVAIGAAASGF